MIIGRTVIGGVLAVLGLLLGLIGASYNDADVLTKPDVSCGAPWFPSFERGADPATCHAITAPRAELGTGLLILGGAILLIGAGRRTVAA